MQRYAGGESLKYLITLSLSSRLFVEKAMRRLSGRAGAARDASFNSLHRGASCGSGISRRAVRASR